MQMKPSYDWADLKSLIPRKNQISPCGCFAESPAKPTPTLLLRGNRYRRFALYVVSEEGSIRVARDGAFVWFVSIDECADALLDLDVDLDFENILLDLGVWDCRSVPPRVEEHRPAMAQDRCLAAEQRQLLRPLGAF